MANIFSKLSAFDLDHTLLKENSSFSFGKYLYRQKHISLSDFFFIIRSNIIYNLGFLSISELHQRAFERLFYGKSLFLVEFWVSSFLDKHLESLFYNPAIKALIDAQQAGHITAIISSSPSFLVEPIAKRLNLTFCQATEYAVDKDHKFCQIASLMLGEDKARFIMEFMKEHKISKKQVIAYSDSILDLPFLLTAGEAIAVNPDRKLRLFCLKHNWPII
ncbi:MAG: HAD-IB family hydrolase [Parachlamydiaceae bacterium]|nr:HAD-IB family hydrolase [Parachlamydiaceae bacterium]